MWLARSLLILLLSPVLLPVTADNDILVKSHAGTFIGAELISYGGMKFAAYRGIPYARPPIASLRFAKPQPVGKLQGVYNATQEGPMCVQIPGVDIGGDGIGQEDCLYLNVYTPMNSTTNLFKVFVYIHGGGNVMGSANEVVPGDLVTKGNVIVVTFNYRLSWLGFLKGNTPELPGNQGTWDQLMALNWVKDNIRDFGGDDEDITLGGESAGAMAVSVLSILKKAQGLFTKGLLMSGSEFKSFSTKGSSDDLFPTLAAKTGCRDRQAPRTMEADEIDTTLECLRNLSQDKFSISTDFFTIVKFLSIDGELISDSIPTLVQNDTYLREVGFFNKDFLVTTTNNEGAIISHGVFAIISPDTSQKSPYSQLSQLMNIPMALPVLERLLLWYSQPYISEILPVYDWMYDVSTFPAINALLSIHATGNEDLRNNSGKSYFLRFEHFPAYLPPPLKGTLHAMDLTYLFDKPPNEILRAYYGLKTAKGFTQDDLEMKDRFINIVTDFMASREPGESMNPTVNWTSYGTTMETYLSFGPYPTVRQNPQKVRRDFLADTLPEWIVEYQAEQKAKEPNRGHSLYTSFSYLLLLVFPLICSFKL